MRITTVIINGDIAAVDIGCVYHGDYTLLGGGTNRDYPGVAKLINLHHMQHGCRERFNLIEEYRRLPFFDPDLPEELLPDNWLRPQAAALFNEYYNLLTREANEYFDSVSKNYRNAGRS